MFSALGGPREPFVDLPGIVFHGIVVAALSYDRVWLAPITAALYGYVLVAADLLEITASVGQDVVLILSGAPLLVMGLRSRADDAN